MKTSVAAIVVSTGAALAASGVSTVTYVECTNALAPDVTLTSTNTITSTYCSECEMGGTATSGPGGATVHTTVYPVTYVNVCPTGYTTQTFTVTESCTGMTPSFSGPGNTGYVPAGFTTAFVPCTVCEATPVTHLGTFPITQGPTAPLATIPAAGTAHTDTVPAGTSAGTSADNSAGNTAAASSASYATTQNTLVPAGSSAATSGPTPFTGSSTRITDSATTLVAAGLMATVVGLFAFLL